MSDQMYLVAFVDSVPSEQSDGSSSVPRAGPELPKNPSSTLSDHYLNGVFREKHEIPDDVELRAPGPLEFVDDDVPGWVAFYEHKFESGLELPIPFTVYNVLKEFGIVPSQLTPNAWRLLLCVQRLGDDGRVNRVFHCDDVAAHYSLKLDKGRYQYRLRKDKTAVVLGLPISEKKWQRRYFFARGPSLFGHRDISWLPSGWRSANSARGNRRNLSECFANFPLVSCLLVPKEERTWENFLIPSKPIEPEMSAKRQKRALVIHPLPPRGVWSVPGVGSSSRRSSPAATVLPDALVTPTVSAPGSAALSAGSTNVVHFEMPSSSSIFGDDSYVPQVLSRIAGSGDDTRVFEMGAARALDWIEARAYQAAACANLTKGLITEKDRQLAEWAEKPAALQSCYDAIAVKMTELELEHGKCLAESDAYAERSAMLARGQVINEVAQGRHHTWDMAGELARWKKFKREEGIPDEEEPSDAA